MQIISLPRDIYIDYSEYVIDELRKAQPSYLKRKGHASNKSAPSIGQTIEYQKDIDALISHMWISSLILYMRYLIFI